MYICIYIYVSWHVFGIIKVRSTRKLWNKNILCIDRGGETHKTWGDCLTSMHYCRRRLLLTSWRQALPGVTLCPVTTAKALFVLLLSLLLSLYRVTDNVNLTNKSQNEHKASRKYIIYLFSKYLLYLYNAAHYSIIYLYSHINTQLHDGLYI